MDKINSCIQELQLNEFVQFTGYREDVADILSIANASVLVSMFEGVPRGLMESMAFGLPVIASNVPGNRQLIVDEKTGLLVNYGDTDALKMAILKLINNYAFAKNIGKKASIVVKDIFNENKVSKRVMEVYDHFLKGNNASVPQWNDIFE